MIQQRLRSTSSLEEQCSIIWDHYVSRKLKSDLEPFWTHTPYQVVKDFLEKKEISNQEKFLLKEVVKSHFQKDAAEVPIKTGFPNEGTRIMHDCWKAGTFTWIFMGRIFCEDIQKHKKYVLINRKLPDEIYNLLDGDSAPQTLYGAYEIDKNSFYGPAVCLEQLINYLDQQDIV